MRSLLINLADAARGPRAASLALIKVVAVFTFLVYWIMSIDEEEASESIGNGVLRMVRWSSMAEMNGVSTF